MGKAPTDTEAFLKHFSSMMGATPQLTTYMWNTLGKPSWCYLCHLLWALLFLKVYSTDSVLASLIGVDKKLYCWQTV